MSEDNKHYHIVTVGWNTDTFDENKQLIPRKFHVRKDTLKFEVKSEAFEFFENHERLCEHLAKTDMMRYYTVKHDKQEPVAGEIEAHLLWVGDDKKTLLLGKHKIECGISYETAPEFLNGETREKELDDDATNEHLQIVEETDIEENGGDD